MSYPSAHKLMTAMVLDETLPVGVRIAALRDQSFRPSVVTLLKLINTPDIPVRLRCCAIRRFSEVEALKKMIREARNAKRTARN